MALARPARRAQLIMTSSPAVDLIRERYYSVDSAIYPSAVAFTGESSARKPPIGVRAIPVITIGSSIFIIFCQLVYLKGFGEDHPLPSIHGINRNSPPCYAWHERFDLSLCRSFFSVACQASAQMQKLK